MPIPSELVGETGEPIEHEVDARWTMAYAGGLGETGAAYFDTAARPDVLAHPVFPVCFEWPLFLSEKHLPTQAVLTREERVRGVHATHDLQLHRPVRAGMRVVTRATVVRTEARRPGAYQVIRLDSSASDGEPVCTTWYGTLYRGVAVEGADRVLPEAEPELSPLADERWRKEVKIPVAATTAHVYTECARIWNPIHTDAAVAKQAGLPAIILHGTATLALGVSRVVETALGGDAERVARVAGRFAGMVRMPSTLTVRIAEFAAGQVRFEVRNEAGEAAVRDGLVAARD